MRSIRYITLTLLTAAGLLAASRLDAQWTFTGGPEGAQVRALAASGSQYFAGTGGGVFTSVDNGATWSARGLGHVQLMAFAVSGTTIYAGGGGVHRSTDNGLSWTDVSTGLTNTDVRSLCISGTYVFAGTAAGVFRAPLAGGNWTAVSSTALGSRMVLALTVSGNFVVAGTLGGGVFRSNNAGGSWSQTNTGISNLYIRALYKSATSKHLYAGGEGGVYQSVDNGKTWVTLNSGLVTGTNATPIVQSLAGTGAKVYAGTYNGGVYYSTDRAATWSATTQQQNTLSLLVNGSTALAGTFSGSVHRSTNNAASWSTVGGITASSVLALKYVGSELYAGLSIPMDVYRANAAVSAWTSTGFGRSTSMLHAEGSTLFAGTMLGGLYYTNNGGLTWTRSGSLRDVQALLSSGGTLFAGAASPFVPSINGVHRSTDNGLTWTQSNTGLAHTRVHALAAAGGAILAGTSDGGIYRSLDGGLTWAASNTGLTTLNIRTLRVHGTDVYAGTYGGGVFRSSTGGASWTAVNTGLGNLRVGAFAVSGSNLFAGTENGPYHTSDGGATWNAVGTGMTGSTSITALEIANGMLYAATLGSGVWKRPVSEMITVPKHSASPVADGLRLEQNYPNPFNPATTIRYTLPVDADVLLRVFDMHGREAAVLEQGMRRAGSHSVVFDARALPSGVYHYRLEAAGAVRTGSMTLVK